MESPILVIRWAESDSRCHNWCIRGLRPDGSFCGEVRLTFEDGATDGAGCLIEGQLDPDDMERIQKFTVRIRENSALDTDSPVRGVLADGPIGDPVVLYRHPNSDDAEATELFLGINAILRPYLALH